MRIWDVILDQASSSGDANRAGTLGKIKEAPVSLRRIHPKTHPEYTNPSDPTA